MVESRWRDGRPLACQLPIYRGCPHPSVETFGASIYEAAILNLTMILPLGYLVLLAVLSYGMFVAYPDDQGFAD